MGRRELKIVYQFILHQEAGRYDQPVKTTTNLVPLSTIFQRSVEQGYKRLNFNHPVLCRVMHASRNVLTTVASLVGF